MKSKKVIVYVIILSLCASINASSFRKRPTTVFSDNMKYLLEMKPYGSGLRDGEGTVYKNDSLNNHPKLWSVDFYSPPYTLHLSNTGENLIIVNSTYGFRRRDVLIEFHNKDGCYKKYKRSELIKDKSKITRSTAGHHWIADTSSVKNFYNENEDIFKIVTVDKNVYEFDVKTGEIIKNYIDSIALNKHEYWALRRKIWKSLGRKTLENVPDLSAFEELFNITNVNYSAGWGDKWSAWLTPKANVQKSMISFETSVDTVTNVATTKYKPKDLLELINKISKIPYFKNILDSNENSSLRIRMSGNSFNQSEYTIPSFMEILESNNYDVGSIENWVELYIDINDKENTIYSYYYIMGSNLILSNYDILNKPEILKQYTNIVNSKTDTTKQYKAAVDTLGNLTVLTYTKKLKPSPNNKVIQKNKFQIFLPRNKQHLYDANQYIEHFGIPDKKTKLENDDQELWIYSNCYIKYVTVYDSKRITKLEADKLLE